MANVHGFGDMRGQENNNQINYRPAGLDQENNEMEEQMHNFVAIQDQLPLLGKSGPPGNPRTQNFCDMLKEACCPAFQWASFIIFITLVDILLYIITLAIGVSSDPDIFLGPTSQTLRKWGEKYPRLQKEGEVYRWIMPLFLHRDFMHILFNATAQLIIGFQLEKTAMALRTMAIYFIAGIGGILFSSLIDYSPSVGASTAIFGLIGAIFAYFIMNWKTLDIVGGMMKCCLCCILIIMLIYLLFFTLMMNNIDGWGHLGGFLTGLPTGFVLLPILKPPRRENSINERKYVCVWRILGAVTLILWFVLGFSLFYTVSNP